MHHGHFAFLISENGVSWWVGLVCIYIYIYVCVCVRERERERERLDSKRLAFVDI